MAFEFEQRYCQHCKHMTYHNGTWPYCSIINFAVGWKFSPASLSEHIAKDNSMESWYSKAVTRTNKYDTRELFDEHCPHSDKLHLYIKLKQV